MVALIRKVLDYPKLYWKKHQFMKNSEMGGGYPYWERRQLLEPIR